MSFVTRPDGDLRVGTFVKTVSPHVVEVLGTAGMDFAVVDAEHAPFDRAAIDLMIMAGRSAGLPILVRIPNKEPSTILSSLDAGAAGLLVPHVDTAEQAAALVRHARFRGGERGYSGSPRYAGYGALGMAEAIRRGDQALLMCQIESTAGLEAVDAIVATEGVDGLFIGRADLSLSLGESSISAAPVRAATERIIMAGRRAGKLVGMFLGSPSELRDFAALGADWFIIGSDQSILREGGKAIASVATDRKDKAA